MEGKVLGRCLVSVELFRVSGLEKKASSCSSLRVIAILVLSE